MKIDLRDSGRNVHRGYVCIVLFTFGLVRRLPSSLWLSYVSQEKKDAPLSKESQQTIQQHSGQIKLLTLSQLHLKYVWQKANWRMCFNQFLAKKYLQNMFFSQHYILSSPMKPLMFVVVFNVTVDVCQGSCASWRKGGGGALIQEAKCQGALSPWDASQSHLTAAAEKARTCITHPFRVTLQYVYRVGPQKNFQPEQIFNSWGCLWLTRVPGPAPGVRFLLSLPMRTGKLQHGLYAFFFFFFFICCCCCCFSHALE